MEELVSIITPTYNCGKFIEDTILCVINQTYTQWELLIVDDCSNDNTKDIVSKYQNKDSRIKYFINNGNIGAALSRNAALREAKGRWIAFLDSDDIWSPNKLEEQIHFMKENECHFSYTNYQEMNESGNLTGIVVTGPKRISKNVMFMFCWPGCLTVMYDKEFIGLLQIEDIKKNNDYAMWLVACKKTDCYLLDECLATYRRGRSGSVSTHGIFTMIKWHYKLFHDAEHLNVVQSIWRTSVNLMCGLYKKLIYVKKYNNVEEVAL